MCDQPGDVRSVGVHSGTKNSAGGYGDHAPCHQPQPGQPLWLPSLSKQCAVSPAVMTRQQSHHRRTETYKSYQPHAFHFYPLTTWTESWPGGQPGREWTPLLPALNKRMTSGYHVDSAGDLSTSKPGPQLQHLIFYRKFIREVL